MATITFPQLLQQLKKKEYQPIYLLHGDESYFIDQVADYIEENVLSDGEKAFNQSILYGKETEAKSLIDTCFRYPMMSPYQVVILKEAQEMRSLKDLKAYVEKAVPTTILVICHKHKKLNLNSAFGKALKAKATILEAKKLYDNQVGDWIRTELKSRKRNIAPEAAELMAEYLGTNLSKVTNALDKLSLNLDAQKTITTEDVEQHVGISKDYNVFELQKALGQGDVLKANRIINYFAADPRKHSIIMLIGTLYNYFSKILMLHQLRQSPENEVLKVLGLRSNYFLREYKQAARRFSWHRTIKVISVLKEYDLKSKGVDFNKTNTEDGALMKELVWKILHI
ncbi:MAG: DNA polymerase III subunit delta [Bacteroidota bacterium]